MTVTNLLQSGRSIRLISRIIKVYKLQVKLIFSAYDVDNNNNDYYYDDDMNFSNDHGSNTPYMKFLTT